MKPDYYLHDDRDEDLHEEEQQQPSSPPRVTPAARAKHDGWHYKDPEGQVHGPFPASKMAAWLAAGYFGPGIKVQRAKHGAPWQTIADTQEQIQAEVLLVVHAVNHVAGSLNSPLFVLLKLLIVNHLYPLFIVNHLYHFRFPGISDACRCGVPAGCGNFGAPTQARPTPSASKCTLPPGTPSRGTCPCRGALTTATASRRTLPTSTTRQRPRPPAAAIAAPAPRQRTAARSRGGAGAGPGQRAGARWSQPIGC